MVTIKFDVTEDEHLALQETIKSLNASMAREDTTLQAWTLDSFLRSVLLDELGLTSGEGVRTRDPLVVKMGDLLVVRMR